MLACQGLRWASRPWRERRPEEGIQPILARKSNDFVTNGNIFGWRWFPRESSGMDGAGTRGHGHPGPRGGDASQEWKDRSGRVQPSSAVNNRKEESAWKPMRIGPRARRCSRIVRHARRWTLATWQVP